MPNSSPRPAPSNRLPTARPLLAVCVLALIFTSAQAQTLARPGLVGNGLNADPWWQHAVFCRTTSASADPEADLKAIVARIDSIHSLGIDALLIPLPTLPQPTADLAQAPSPALEAFDDLIRESSRRGIRTLLIVPANTTVVDLSGMARFWLTRGIAGFYVTTPPGASPQDAQTVLQALRKAAASTYGQRIVLSDLDPTAPAVAVATPSAPIRRSPHRTTSHASATPADLSLPQLQIDPRLGRLEVPTAAAVRSLLTPNLNQPNLALDLTPPATPADPSNPFTALAKPLAAVLLATHTASVIESAAAPTLPAAPPEETTPASTPPPPDPTRTFTIVTAKPPAPAKDPTPTQDPVTDWYQQLSQLHHDNAALRYGTISLLDFDAQNALVWIARPATNSPLNPPVVVLCNLASTPVQLDLGAAIKSLTLHGSYLRTLLRSDKAMGPQDLNGVVLPPFSVYIGELHR